jgi:hypothetical protein
MPTIVEQIEGEQDLINTRKSLAKEENEHRKILRGRIYRTWLLVG